MAPQRLNPRASPGQVKGRQKRQRHSREIRASKRGLRVRGAPLLRTRDDCQGQQALP
jgi:hypothetical protein